MKTGEQAPIPFFGIKQEGIDYLNRPGVYAILVGNDERIGLIETSQGYFLPGGGIDPNEADSDALTREILEETGYQAAVGGKLGETIEYLQAVSNGQYYQIRSRFYAAQLGSKIGEGSEADHRLVWFSPEEAVQRLIRSGQIWAVQRLVNR